MCSLLIGDRSSFGKKLHELVYQGLVVDIIIFTCTGAISIVIDTFLYNYTCSTLSSLQRLVDFISIIFIVCQYLLLYAYTLVVIEFYINI